MKKTQLKDALRIIRKQTVSFASIVVIALLAAMVYLGISYAAKALNLHISGWYGERNAQDLQVVSPLLLTEDDVEAIRSLDGVADAEGNLETTAWLPTPEGFCSLSVISVPDRIALPQLLEGRFPQSPEECMIEQGLAEEQGIRIGDRIRLEGDDGGVPALLKSGDFTVTGIVYHPDHISYEIAVSWYVLVEGEAFDRDALNGDFVRVRLTLTDPPKDRFTNAYWKQVRPVENALKELAAERGPLRLADYEETLASAERELAEKQRELEDAERQLADARAELADAERRITEGEEELRKAEELLQEEGKRLDWYGGAVSLLEYARAILDGREEPNPWDIWEYFSTYYDESYGDLGLELLEELVEGFDPENPGDLPDAIEKVRELYDKTRNNYYYAGELYMDGLTLLEKGKKELAAKKQEYADAVSSISEAETEIADGWEALRAARRELDAGREQLDSVKGLGGTVLNNHADSGYMYCKENSGNLSSLSLTFSMLFIVVAALVIYASVGRMVDEQSRLVGTTRALGMYAGEILLKYVVFGLLSTLLGIVLGILAACFGLQPLILRMYSAYYNTPQAASTFLPLQTLIVLAGGTVIALLAVWFACERLFRSTALRLMNGEGPKSRLRQRKDASGSLYSRLILLNMRSDLRRVAVTVVSIAGCCILLMVGFALKFGMQGLTRRQFEEIQTYDARVEYDASAGGAASALSELLSGCGTDFVGLLQESRPFSNGDDLSVCSLICPETAESLAGFYSLRDARSGAAAALPEHGVLISKRTHEYYRLSVGDTVTLYDGRMQAYEAQVAGILDNYCDHHFFTSPAGYREIFGSEPEQNCFYVKRNGADLSELRHAARNIEGFRTVTDATAQREQLEQTAGAMSVLVLLMIVAAGLMAYFILMNLSGSYMIHKKKELTVMRINGFTVRECVRYAAAELAVTSVLGILIGIPAGAGLGYLVVRLTEQSGLQLVRSVDMRSVVFSILITAGFSLLINGWSLRQVRHLKLSDI